MGSPPTRVGKRSAILLQVLVDTAMRQGTYYQYLQPSLRVCSTRFRIRYPPAHTCTESVICNATLLNPLSRLAFDVLDRHTPHPAPTLREGSVITIWTRHNDNWKASGLQMDQKV